VVHAHGDASVQEGITSWSCVCAASWPRSSTRSSGARRARSQDAKGSGEASRWCHTEQRSWASHETTASSLPTADTNRIWTRLSPASLLKWAKALVCDASRDWANWRASSACGRENDQRIRCCTMVRPLFVFVIRPSPRTAYPSAVPASVPSTVTELIPALELRRQTCYASSRSRAALGEECSTRKGNL